MNWDASVNTTGCARIAESHFLFLRLEIVMFEYSDECIVCRSKRCLYPSLIDVVSTRFAQLVSRGRDHKHLSMSWNAGNVADNLHNNIRVLE